MMAAHIGAEVDHEMPEVVLLTRADRAVGQEHERAGAHEAPHGVMRVDPRVHAGGGVQLRARRTELHRHDRRHAVERRHQGIRMRNGHQVRSV